MLGVRVPSGVPDQDRSSGLSWFFIFLAIALNANQASCPALAFLGRDPQGKNVPQAHFSPYGFGRTKRKTRRKSCLSFCPFPSLENAVREGWESPNFWRRKIDFFAESGYNKKDFPEKGCGFAKGRNLLYVMHKFSWGLGRDFSPPVRGAFFVLEVPDEFCTA